MLSVQNVTKHYRNTRALDGVSVDVPTGEVLAVIGANGAGKSTLLKCVVGLIRFGGEITVGGRSVAKNAKEARRFIGYLPQNPAFHEDLRVRETAVFYADLKGATHEQAKELVAAVGLEEHAEKRVAELSGGMRQRLGLAVAQLGDPRLVILDEPASGLDVSARLELREIIVRQRELGRAVVLSTHWLEDVPYIADHALALEAGRVSFYGQAKDLAANLVTGSRMYLRLNGATSVAMPIIDRFAAHGPAERRGEWVILRCPADEKVRLVEALIHAGVHILDFRIEEAPLESTTLAPVERGA